MSSTENASSAYRLGYKYGTKYGSIRIPGKFKGVEREQFKSGVQDAWYDAQQK